MLAVQVELLTGRYVATRFNDRNRAEWPPHPARLFSAAVAAWADADDPDERERAALRWWEEQGEPTVTCSWDPGGYSERSAVVHYVPVNDTQVVGRDPSTTYARLRAAIAAFEGAEEGDPKGLAKAELAAAKMRKKATEDSARAGSTGRAPASALGLLPDARVRQARVYPTVIPADDRVTYQWPDADRSSPHLPVLDRLLARIPRLGHSSSLVAVSVVDKDDEPTLVPDSGGDVRLRVASSGQLDALEAAFVAHQGSEPRVLTSLVASYRRASDEGSDPPAPILARDWMLLELTDRAGDPTHFTICDTLAIGRAVRGALLHHAEEDPAPEILTGHVPGSEKPTPPTTRPHLAVVPMPFVGHPHADGRIRAIALVLPKDLAVGERRQAESAVERWMEAGGELRLGARRTVNAARLPMVDAPASARPYRWCGPSRHWVSATPIALDRNPGNLRHSDIARRDAAERAAEDVIAAACVNIGLPAPIRVAIHAGPLLRGSASVRSFPKYAVLDGRIQRLLVHAAFEFGEEVSGPVLLGAGRYHGYGLCFPMAVVSG